MEALDILGLQAPLLDCHFSLTNGDILLTRGNNLILL